MTRLIRLVVTLATAAGLLAALVGGIAYSSSRFFHDFASTREEPLPVLAIGAEVPSVIYAADGSVIATLRSSLNRQPVALNKISPLLIAAVLDTEDHAFWHHGGLDVESTVRALLADVSAGSAVQGGSTIAQQLVKGTYLNNQKTLSRKVREAVLAQRLEQKYTKAQILDAYLNSVYLGNGAYGVQAASEEYFGKGARHLGLAQAALLAGLLQAPSGYNPLTNPLGARERRSQVLSRMVHYRTITPAEAAAADERPLPTKVREAPGISYTHYGYYVEEVVNQLLSGSDSALGATEAERAQALFTGGLKIYTNEVPSLQAHAANVAVADIPSSLPHVVAAFAVIDPRTGDVEALVGGTSSANNQFDAATEGERQPGSGFKLFTLIGALEENYNVDDSILATSPCAVLFPGVPYAYGYNLSHLMHNDPGGPGNPGYSQVTTLVQATALSVNCAYLRLAHEVGLPTVIGVAKSMGLSDPTLNPLNPSLVIGTEAVRPVEMAAAYATVADGGIYHPPTFINHIVGRGGTTIYNGETEGTRVFSNEVAEEALVALQATVQYGTGTAAALPNHDVAGKTGTTENSVDAWFNGITPTLASSVWIGDPTGEVPMYANGVEVYGASYPTQIWHDVMAYALRDTPYSAFPAPDPALTPPVRYIDSLGLLHDDLLSHGGVVPSACSSKKAGKKCPSKTTTTKARATTTTKATTPKTTAPRPTTTRPTTTRPTTTRPTTTRPTTTRPTTTRPTTTRPTTTRPTAPRPTTTRPTTTRPTTTTTTVPATTTTEATTTTTRPPTTTRATTTTSTTLPPTTTTEATTTTTQPTTTTAAPTTTTTAPTTTAPSTSTTTPPVTSTTAAPVTTAPAIVTSTVTTSQPQMGAGPRTAAGR